MVSKLFTGQRFEAFNSSHQIPYMAPGKDQDLEERLSTETLEMLLRTGELLGDGLRPGIREQYFLSSGAGMELWEVLKHDGFSPEKLERCKNELRDEDLLTVESSEHAAPYYVRFDGKLADSIDFLFQEDHPGRTGQCRMEVRKRERWLEFDRESLEEFRDRELEVDGAGEEVLERLMELDHGSIERYADTGIIADMIGHGMDDERFSRGVEELEDRGIVREEVRSRKQDRCVFFVSEWVERSDEQTRFYFSPGVYERFIQP